VRVGPEQNDAPAFEIEGAAAVRLAPKRYGVVRLLAMNLDPAVGGQIQQLWIEWSIGGVSPRDGERGSHQECCYDLTDRDETQWASNTLSKHIQERKA
jgi:hypothetical protein